MLTTEISSLPPSGSTKSLSSESTAELLSSESSLTGMSFSSSSDSFGVRDSTNTNTSMKDDVTAVSANSSLVSLSSSLEDDEDSNKGRDTMSDSLPSEGKAQESDKVKLVRIESIELLLENSQDNLSNDMGVTPEGIPCEQFPTLNTSKETSLLCSPKTECTDVTNKPRELTKRNGDTEAAENNYQNQIGHLQEAVQELTDSEDVLKQRLESLQNELKSAKNNTEYWFNQCVKKKEKIEELLIATRDVTSDNFELRQKINKKTRIINEKDQEIQKLTQSNTETEMILREVKERLSKANEETERLKRILRQHDEEKRSSALQTDREALFKSLMSNSLKGNEKGSLSLTHKETTSMPSRDREGLQRKVNNSQFHPVSVSSLNSEEKGTNRVNKEELTASDTNAKSTSALEDGNRGAIPLRLPTSDGSGSLREPPLITKFPMTKDPEKTKKDVKEWLSEVIRQAKTKLAGERVVSHHEGIDKNERPTDAESEKEGAKSSLREAMFLFKGKISKDVSRLPKQQKKNISCLRFPKTKKNDRQEPLTTTGNVAKGSHVWNRNLAVEQRAKQQDEPTLDAKDANLATNASADTFTSMEPFDGVFISDFDFMEFSTSGRMDSVEPFGEVFLPWMDSKDAENKQTTGVLEPNVTRKEQHPDNKVNLDEFFSASDAKKTESKEKKTGQSSGMP